MKKIIRITLPLLLLLSCFFTTGCSSNKANGTWILFETSLLQDQGGNEKITTDPEELLPEQIIFNNNKVKLINVMGNDSLECPLKEISKTDDGTITYKIEGDNLLWLVMYDATNDLIFFSEKFEILLPFTVMGAYERK